MANEIKNENNVDENKVQEFKNEIKSGAWTSIASEVWGNERNIRAFSQAAREQQNEKGGSKIHFEKDEQGSLSIVFDNASLFKTKTRVALK
jgi:hypothetical protein